MIAVIAGIAVIRSRRSRLHFRNVRLQWRFVTLKLMSVKAIQLGQLWRKNSSGEVFLVTKLYDEVFSKIAVLRRAGANGVVVEGDTVRVKVQHNGGGASLPGYSFTQEAQDF